MCVTADKSIKQVRLPLMSRQGPVVMASSPGTIQARWPGCLSILLPPPSLSVDPRPSSAPPSPKSLLGSPVCRALWDQNTICLGAGNRKHGFQSHIVLSPFYPLMFVLVLVKFENFTPIIACREYIYYFVKSICRRIKNSGWNFPTLVVCCGVCIIVLTYW